MDEKLELKLVEKYPIIFQEYGGDIRTTCMGWGISSGDGWFKLIYNLCEDITKIIGDKNIEVIATQIKEKFGGLRFYYVIINTEITKSNKLSNKIQTFMFSRKLGIQYWAIVNFRKKFWKTTEEKICDRIDQAERDSYKICEVCGRPGEARGNGWIKTTCELCN